MTRVAVFDDEAWTRIEPLLPPVKKPMGRPSRPHRPVVEGMVYRARTGLPWRDLPDEFDAWQTAHRRFKTWSDDGTLDRVLAELLIDADVDGQLVWDMSVDSTVARVQQHGATAARCSAGPSSHTGGEVE